MNAGCHIVGPKPKFLPFTNTRRACYVPRERRRYQATQKHRFFFRWFKSDFLEGAQDFTYETERGLMNWDEKRPTASGAFDWTYAASPSTILNVTADTNWFLLKNQRLGTRKYKPSDAGLPTYMETKCGSSCVMPRILFPGMTFWNGDMVMGTAVDPGTGWGELDRRGRD